MVTVPFAGGVVTVKVTVSPLGSLANVKQPLTGVWLGVVAARFCMLGAGLLALTVIVADAEVHWFSWSQI